MVDQEDEIAFSEAATILPERVKQRMGYKRMASQSSIDVVTSEFEDVEGVGSRNFRGLGIATQNPKTAPYEKSTKKSPKTPSTAQTPGSGTSLLGTAAWNRYEGKDYLSEGIKGDTIEEDSIFEGSFLDTKSLRRKSSRTTSYGGSFVESERDPYVDIGDEERLGGNGGLGGGNGKFSEATHRDKAHDLQDSP
jgi:hypothetical protein